MDVGITSAADLAASSWNLPQTRQGGAISGDATFHHAFEAAATDTKESADTPEKIEGAAKQFEALMVNQILKTARESSGGGWLDDEDGQEDQTGSMVMELAEQGFSQAIAARGGLGIAKMVAANLERGRAKTARSDSEAQPAFSTNTDSKR